VYWRPLFYVLEETLASILVNATQMARVPGRKRDGNDAPWIAQLPAHLDYLAEAIETVSTQIDGAMAPFAEILGRLDTI
jgi:hypothetical protein